MPYSAFNVNRIKALVVFVVLAVLACFYLTAKIITARTELKALQARCALQEEALKRPATSRKADKTTVTTTRIIRLTDQEKTEICEKYDIKIQALNDLLRHYQEKTRITQDKSVTESLPMIPEVPGQAASVLYYSLLTCYNIDSGVVTLGATRRIYKTFEIGGSIDTEKHFGIVAQVRF